MLADALASTLVPALAHAGIQASFDCSPSCVITPGTSATFRSTSTTDSALRLYSWDLDGDGRYGADDEPDELQGSDASQATHAFADAGEFTVGLRVTNAAAEQSTATRTVTVRAAPAPPPQAPPPPPADEPVRPVPPSPTSDGDGDG